MEIKDYIRTIHFFKLLLSVLFLAMFMVPFLLIISTFFIYRTFVFAILKLKFGSKVDGIMNGLDAFFAADSKNIINIIMIAKTENSFEEFYRKFKEVVNRRMFQNTQNDPKLLSTRHTLYGYHYFIKNQLEIDACVRSINLNLENEEISKNELMEAISNKYCNQMLPYNNTSFWEILLCENSIKWNDKIDHAKKSYAILFRFHHSFADGITIMKFMFNTFSNTFEEIQSKTPPSQNNLLQNYMNKIFDFVYILLITPIVVSSEIFPQHKEDLDVLSLSDQQIMVVKTEESRKCIKIIKSIKRKVQGAHFMDILAVAISKSFSIYFQKKEKHPNSSYVYSYITILTENAPHNLKFTKLKTIKLQNLFSVAKLSIPIIHNTNAESSYWENFIATLKKIKNENEYFKDKHDSKVLYGVSRVVTYFFPESVFLRLVYYSNFPLIISNVPGPPTITLFDDCYIEDLFVWVPRPKGFGLTLGFLTYDERLQITLTVDKEIISDTLDAQDIVDGIYQALILVDGSS